jgi:hypothetical protein
MFFESKNVYPTPVSLGITTKSFGLSFCRDPTKAIVVHDMTRYKLLKVDAQTGLCTFASPSSPAVLVILFHGFRNHLNSFLLALAEAGLLFCVNSRLYILLSAPSFMPRAKAR